MLLIRKNEKSNLNKCIRRLVLNSYGDEYDLEQTHIFESKVCADLFFETELLENISLCRIY